MRHLEVLRAQFALRNLAVAETYRSHGSMIHLHLGEQYDHAIGQRTVKRGEFRLMVEMADWEIKQHRRRLAISYSDNWKIDHALGVFIGARIKTARFTCSNSTIEFTRGLELVLRPDPHLFGNWFVLGNWTLFQRNEVSVALDYRSHRLTRAG